MADLLKYSFNKLIGRQYTWASASWFAENPESTLKLHSSDIWVDDIADIPVEVDNIVVKYTDLELTKNDSVLGGITWYAIDNSVTPSQDLKDFISPKYSPKNSGYSVNIKVVLSNSEEFFPSALDAGIKGTGWVFDYESGILTFDNLIIANLVTGYDFDDPDSVNEFNEKYKDVVVSKILITAYQYIGKTLFNKLKELEDKIDDNPGGGGGSGGVGPAGPKGDQGETGPAGPKGDDGVAGAIGPKGDPGEVGSIGPKGDDGVAGAIGPKGDQGEIGPAGPKGDDGVAGAIGPKGDPGEVGSIGPIGPAGSKGDPGEDGVDGRSFNPKGNYSASVTYKIGDVVFYPAGGYPYVCLLDNVINYPPTGTVEANTEWVYFPIPVGPKGDKGDIGPAGPKGEDGIIGVDGITGPVGPIGPAGPKGEDGVEGPAGKGETGPTGPAGPKGEDGVEGPAGKGETGPIGPAGPKGEDGVEGPAGKGETGPTGPAGSVGIKGDLGETGPAGVQGLRGPSGPTGFSAYDAWISLGNFGSTGDFIDWLKNDITGLEKRVKRLEGFHVGEPSGPTGPTGPDPIEPGPNSSTSSSINFLSNQYRLNPSTYNFDKLPEEQSNPATIETLPTYTGGSPVGNFSEVIVNSTTGELTSPGGIATDVNNLTTRSEYYFAIKVSTTLTDPIYVFVSFPTATFMRKFKDTSSISQNGITFTVKYPGITGWLDVGAGDITTASNMLIDGTGVGGANATDITLPMGTPYLNINTSPPEDNGIDYTKLRVWTIFQKSTDFNTSMTNGILYVRMQIKRNDVVCPNKVWFNHRPKSTKPYPDGYTN